MVTRSVSNNAGVSSRKSAIRVQARSAAATSLGRTVIQRRTALALLLAVLALVGLGIWGHSVITRSLKAAAANELEGLLRTAERGLTRWLEQHERIARAIANGETVPPALLALAQLSKPGADRRERLLAAPEQQTARKELELLTEGLGFTGFAVTDETGIVLLANDDRLVGFQAAEEPELYPAWVRSGKSRVRLAFRSRLMKRLFGESHAPPISVISSPIVLEDERALGAIHLMIPPEGPFSEILKAARPGKSGETYAFNRDGWMISDSRFIDQLKKTGLLAPGKHSSILEIELRDPGANLVLGATPNAGPARRPLTVMAASATRGISGVNVQGYNDYRGVPVIGAWTWLDTYGFGIATEVDVAEAFELENTLKEAFLGLFAVLGVAVLALVSFGHMLARLRRRSEAAERRALRLGRYTLKDKLGEGGMGEVYQATHTLLRRPTAIKLLKRYVGDEEAALRFEREVQLTSQLTHPNTIAIYDYGRTPAGVFYYAMELLSGINLQQLVDRHGAVVPARAIHILVQVCGALGEAHSKGLIHRDIKPPNVFLCERGGAYDTVKVLDFGLVKSVVPAAGDDLVTQVGAIIGTPHFMAPEIVRNALRASIQSDIYAVGAVAYFLLTARFLFDGDTPMEVCVAQMTAEPKPMHEYADVPADLEAAVMACLAKRPEERPESMEVLAARLCACQNSGGWTNEAAAAWWREHRTHATPEAYEPVERTITIDAVG
ncbi:MAG TPA: serine/threonine protein kinase [Polyangiaceae bacterium]|nr:serine/threonine protein kinase [Polyangiaceae bacterium]